MRFKSNKLSHRLWKMTDSLIKAACSAFVSRSFTRLLTRCIMKIMQKRAISFDWIDKCANKRLDCAAFTINIILIYTLIQSKIFCKNNKSRIISGKTSNVHTPRIWKKKSKIKFVFKRWKMGAHRQQVKCIGPTHSVRICLCCRRLKFSKLN